MAFSKLERFNEDMLSGQGISKKAAFMMVGIILILGVFLRAWNLGKCGFWTDEIYHTIAAQSMLKTGVPIFPSGAQYKRCLVYTRIVSLFFKYLGVNEAAARAPSVLFNLAFLVIGFFCVRHMIDNMTALFFLVVMSFSPYCIYLARECRMYPAFQLFYFLASLFFFFGYEYQWDKHPPAHNREPLSVEKKYGVNLILLTVSGACLFMSFKFHALTKTFVITAASYVTVMLVVQFWKIGLRKAIASKYGLSLLVLCLIFIVVVFVDPGYISEHFHKLKKVSPWAEYQSFPTRYYYWFLSEKYSFLFFLYPAGLVWLLSRDSKLGIFMACSFLPVLIVLSVLAKLKNTRYIFHLFPFFVVVSSYAIPKMIEVVWKLTDSSLRQITKKTALRRGILIGTTVISLNAFCYPWLLNSVKIPFKECQSTDWKTFYKRTGRYLITDDAKFITTNQNLFYFYFGKKPDFYLSAGYYRNLGDAEQFVGASPITNVKELRLVLAKNKSVYLVTDKWRFYNPFYVTPELREFVRQNFKTIPLDYPSKIILYKNKDSDKT